MKKFLYYAAIVAVFIVVCLGGVFICAALYAKGSFPMLIVTVVSIGAAKLTGVLLKDKLNPTPPEN